MVLGRRPTATSTLSQLSSSTLAFGVFDRQLDALLEDLAGGDLGFESKVHALVGEGPLQSLGHLFVGERSDGREHLDHGDLGAEPPPHATQLEPDRTGADHDQPFGHRS